ncbi:signal recognition particle protein [Candidatus Bipolaricaulota bacterium]|nr:signal recognition particle protein [Candidatus Bipolaricaulota bacterium]
MFESLTDRLTQVFQRLRGKGLLTQADVEEGLREIREVLLSADVHHEVVRELLSRVRERAVGEKLVESLSPAQQLLAIVRQEMVRVMGGEAQKLKLAGRPAVVLLVGPAGGGKTTTAGKLGQYLRKRGRNPLLVSADPERPAAAEQLATLAQKIGIPFESADQDPLTQVPQILGKAKKTVLDVAIVDTPGTPPGAPPPSFLADLFFLVKPSDVLLVLDALVGQEAIRMGEAFLPLGLTGIVLTKLDGDARGGAALSLPSRLRLPIVFVGVGERPEDLEPFEPGRMADRILGLGDLSGLVEKLQEAGVTAKAEKILKEEEFTLEDFLAQMEAVRRAGPLEQLLSRLPGFARPKEDEVEREFKKMKAIIQSMTVEERRNPHIIGASRKRRIARGSGTTVQDVNRLLAEYEQAKKLLKGLKHGKIPGGKFPFPR